MTRNTIFQYLTYLQIDSIICQRIQVGGAYRMDDDILTIEEVAKYLVVSNEQSTTGLRKAKYRPER